MEIDAVSVGVLKGRLQFWIEKAAALQKVVDAQAAIIGWYEEEMEREHADEIPEELDLLEKALIKARCGS